MVLTHIDMKYVSLTYRKIYQKVPNGEGLMFINYNLNLDLESTICHMARLGTASATRYHYIQYLEHWYLLCNFYEVNI